MADHGGAPAEGAEEREEIRKTRELIDRLAREPPSPKRNHSLERLREALSEALDRLRRVTAVTRSS